MEEQSAPRGRRVLYKFVPTKKIEVMTARGKVYLFDTEQGEGRVSLRENSFDLANLFNGHRSEEEIRDIVLKAKGLSLSAEDLRDFIVKLSSEGLLEEVRPRAPDKPGRLGRRSAAQRLLTHSDAALENLSNTEDGFASLNEGHDSGWGPAGSSAAGEARRSRRPPRYERVTDLDLDDKTEVEDEEFGSYSADESDSPPRSDQAPSTPEELLEEAFETAAGPTEARGRLRKLPRRARLLFRLPVGRLLPAAATLGWAGRSRYAAILLLGLLCATIFGLWHARVELVRDFDRWFVPLNILQSVLLALVTVNLWTQLARAAEYKRRLGEAPQFGIALAWNIFPVFAADLSGLAKAMDIKAAKSVFGASLSAVATICLLTYGGWLASKNNGTTIPLVLVGLAYLATIRLLLSLNPLSRRDGYYLLALTLGIPDLRQRALGTLLGRQLPPLPRSARVRPPGWILSAYALAVVAYLVAVVLLATIFIGGWMEIHWGGFGVLLYVTLVMLVFLGPIREVRAGRASRSRSLQSRRPRSPRQRLGSMAKPALALGTLTVLGLLPYKYEPGGEFLLRPLQSNRTDVRSLISGRVEQLMVQEGDRVEANQVVARISADEERKNLDSTAANIRELEAQLAMARAGATSEAVAVARQRVSTAKTSYQYSQLKAERAAQLNTSGFVSAQEYENLKAQADNDREQLLQMEKELAQLLAGARAEEIDALRAAIDEQKANLQYYAQRMQQAEIRSPIPGYVVSGSLILAAGNYLKQGDLLLSIEESSQLVAEIQVPQFDIAFTQVGAHVRLKAWTSPDLEIEGTVSSIAPSANDTPAGKMVRVTSEIDNTQGLLKSGMTGFAKIEGEELPAALAFTRWIVRFFQIELWSWLP